MDYISTFYNYCSDSTTIALLNSAIKLVDWLDEEGNFKEYVRSSLHKLLLQAGIGWEDIVRTGHTCLSVALQKVKQIGNTIVRVCEENKDFLLSLAKFGPKTFIRVATAYGTKTAGKVLLKSAAGEVVLASVLRSSVNPVAIVADFAQAGLDWAGYRQYGRAVGSVGNVGSGAAYGFMAGGPLGAAVGASAGACVWFTGELAGAIADGLMAPAKPHPRRD